MKPFIKKVLYFLIPILALAYPLDWALSCILKKTIKGPYEHQVWNYIYESKEVPDIAIYGSSKAWVQVSPEILEKTLKKSVYNYGFDGYILKYDPNQVLPTHRDPVKGGKHYRMNIGWGKSLFVIKSKIWRFKLGKLSIHIFRPDIFPHSLIINERTYKLSLGFVKYKGLNNI
jgi:hypothetical protein